MRIAAIEATAVIGVQRQPEPDAPGQIRIRDKMASERNQVGIASGDNFTGPFAVEPSGCQYRTLVEFAEIDDRDWWQAFSFFLAADHAGFDNMEISEAEGSERLDDRIERRSRIAVRHAVPFSAWSNPYGNAIIAPY